VEILDRQTSPLRLFVQCARRNYPLASPLLPPAELKPERQLISTFHPPLWPSASALFSFLLWWQHAT